VDATTPAGRKTLLHSQSGYARPGRLLAIMGSSGAGKSTLVRAEARFVKPFSGGACHQTSTDVSQLCFLCSQLDVLAANSSSSNLEVGGVVRLDGSPRHKATFSKIASYVQQASVCGLIGMPAAVVTRVAFAFAAQVCHIAPPQHSRGELYYAGWMQSRTASCYHCVRAELLLF
jgi:ABC-type hemin transport system ATPase subunit